MKKILALLALTLSVSANAQHHHHHGGHIGGYGVWPLLIGGTVGYIAAREMNKPVIVQQPPVVIQQPPVVYNNSTPVYNLSNPPYAGATPLYEKRTQYDYNCNCYVVVYNQIGWQ